MSKLFICSLVLAGSLFAVPASEALADPPFVEIHIGSSRPPPVRREVRVVSPGPDYVWVGGYWDWRGGDWYWVDGHWDLRPAPRAYWVRPTYVHEYGRTRYTPGRWSTWTVRESDDYRQWKAERNKNRHHHGRGRGHHK